MIIFFRENTTHKRQLQKTFGQKKNILLTVYFVDCTNAWNTWSIISHLSIPICQTFVGIFSCGVKNQNTGVSLMVVRWVHRLKFFLSSSVPKIFIKNIWNLKYTTCILNFSWDVKCMKYLYLHTNEHFFLF